MQTNTRTETAHAMRTIVLWITLLLLSPYASCVVRAQGGTTEQPVVLARIKEYIAFPSSVFDLDAGGIVDFTKSATTCRDHGGVLSADQNDAAHEAIFEKLMSVAGARNVSVFTFLGGDMMYSINFGIGGNPKCVRGGRNPSLNCVYQWNLGIFADPTVDHCGVSFYRGSMYNVSGSGPMNGYSSRFNKGYPASGQPFVLAFSRSPNFTDMYWADSNGLLSWPYQAPRPLPVIVCEIQDGGIFYTTATPMTTKPPLWLEEYWYVPVVASVGAAAFFFLLAIIFFCVCCLSKEVDPIFPMILREKGGSSLNDPGGLHGCENIGILNHGNYGVDPNGQGMGLYPEWNQMNHFSEPQAFVKVIRKFPDEVHGDQEIATSPNTGEKLLIGQNRFPSTPQICSLCPLKIKESSPHEKEESSYRPVSWRPHSFRRVRGRKLSDVSMSEIEVPKADEIPENKEDAQLRDAASVSRSRFSVDVEVHEF